MAAEPTNEELVREACRSYDIRIPGAHREQSLDALLRERQQAREDRDRANRNAETVARNATTIGESLHTQLQEARAAADWCAAAHPAQPTNKP